VLLCFFGSRKKVYKFSAFHKLFLREVTAKLLNRTVPCLLMTMLSWTEWALAFFSVDTFKLPDLQRDCFFQFQCLETEGWRFPYSVPMAPNEDCCL
jgi:hypothetical protein